jgi:hypothetical protein
MSYNYWCSNRIKCADCTLCNSKGDIQSEDKYKGAHCENDPNIKLKLMGESVNISLDQRKKGRTKKDAQKRSSDDFKKNILPTMGGIEKRHFRKKYGYKS